MAEHISANYPVAHVVLCGLCLHPNHVGPCGFDHGYTSTSAGCICNIVPLFVTEPEQED